MMEKTGRTIRITIRIKRKRKREDDEQEVDPDDEDFIDKNEWNDEVSRGFSLLSWTSACGALPFPVLKNRLSSTA